MKIEQLLVQHFYQTRKVSLQGMGSFTLSPDVIIPMEMDKEILFPENSIGFQFNPKATEDDALINFIVQQTRKIKPLASADLDSYLVLGKQFLNIGKPFKIDGLGTLEKNQLGDYEFKQGHFLVTKMEAAPGALREKIEDDDISFAAKRHKPEGNKKQILITIAVILLGLAGWAAWHFLHKKNNPDKDALNATELIEPPKIMSKTEPGQNAVLDNKDSLKVKVPVLPPSKEYMFKVVFKITDNREAAVIKMKDLIARGHRVIMYTRDSVWYKLAETFQRPLSDTTRIKDSLNKYYYLGKAHIELD